MGFFLVLDNGKAVIKYQGPSDTRASLMEAIQQCLAQRVTDIAVELPTKEAESVDLFDVLSKLHMVLQKRSAVLKLKYPLGTSKTELVTELLSLGCQIAADSQNLQEVEVQKLREKQNSTKERALKMLEEIKSNQKQLNEFGIDFPKLYKAADFQAWPEISDFLDKVKATLELELRQREKLEREKKLYVSRISHLKKVTEIGAADAKDLTKMRQIEDELHTYNAELSELANRLLVAQDLSRKSEIEARVEIARCQKEYGPVIEKLTSAAEGQKKK